MEINTATGDSIIENSYFIGNVYGLVLTSVYSFYLTNTHFSSNSHIALQISSSNGSIASSSFTYNYGASGVASYISDSSVIISTTEVNHNNLTSNGALYFSNSQISLNNVNGHNNTGYLGALMYSSTSTFDWNYGTITNNTGYNGGAIHVTSSSTPSFSNLVMNYNQGSYSGGAVYISLADLDLVPTFTNCTFNSNRANGMYGGAIFSNKEAIIVSCSFLSGFARYAGGAMYMQGETTMITSSIFEYNVVTDRGGAVCSNSLSIIGSTFSHNTVENGGELTGYGGALVVMGTLDMYDSIVTDNGAGDTGGMSVRGVGMVSNCTFSNNHASMGPGGAVVNEGYDFTFHDSRFTNNSANNGGAIYNMMLLLKREGVNTKRVDAIFTITMDNTTCVGNTAQLMGGCFSSDFSDEYFVVNVIIRGSTINGNTVVDLEGGEGGGLYVVNVAGNRILKFLFFSSHQFHFISVPILF